MITWMLAGLALAAVDPCAPVAARAPDPAAAAEYRAVAQAEQEAGNRETAAAAWRLAAERDPSDEGARAALAALCREGSPVKAPPANPMAEAIRLLDAGRYREAAELLHAAARGRPGSDAALLEGICRFELREDAEAARLLREAEADPEHRETARLYLGLLALRGGSAREAASLFDSAAGNPSLAALAGELSRSAQWDSPVLLSLLVEGGWDSNVSLATSGTGGQGMGIDGAAVGGITAAAIGRPFGANGLFLRAAAGAQQYAGAGAYDFTSLEGAAGARWWRGGSGLTAEYSYASRTLGGDAYLATHRLLAIGAVAAGPVSLTGSWWGRWEDYATTWAGYSGFAQRADGRLSVALGSRVRLGAGWMWGRDDADLSWLGWKEHGPRADLRVVLGPRTRVAVEGGYALRRYADHDPNLVTLAERLEENVVDAAAALEWDVQPRATLRFSLAFRSSDSNLPEYAYTKWVPSLAVGLLMTP